MQQPPPPPKTYKTNETKSKFIDNTWSSDLFDMNDYKAANKNGYRYIFVVFDDFSNVV